MLTLFTTAKAFRGHTGVIQRNALGSWKRLHPDVEIILFGDEEGTEEACGELGLRHEPHAERTATGEKYVSYLFSRAQALARHDFLCYANCDIVLMGDFWKAFERVRRRAKPFLMIGKRWDTEVTEDFTLAGGWWEERLRARARAQGAQRQYEIDYFLFSRGLFGEIPPLVIGRIYWDHWLVWKARSSGAAIVDASFAVTAVHQNHDYGYHPRGRQGVFEDELARRNVELAGNGKHLCEFEDSTHLLTRSGLLLWTPLRKQAHKAQRLLFYVLVHKTLGARKRLGLQRRRPSGEDRGYEPVLPDQLERHER